METYVYLCFAENTNNFDVEMSVKAYLEMHSIKASSFYRETYQPKTVWADRKLKYLMEEIMNPGDQLVVFEAANLGRSVCQVLEVMQVALAHGINIHFVREDQVFHATPHSDITTLLDLIAAIGQTFASRQTLDDCIRRQQSLSLLGRPRGRKNKVLKLDRHREDIMRYLTLKVSKASIAKLVDCHPQTLYEWISKNKLSDMASEAETQ
ncbi:MAG: hypothetical protein EBX40_01615 [Gammaproteobacteria bacterium]|nr:hypothetical protein [Gammaproteobacteria bacterium]